MSWKKLGLIVGIVAIIAEVEAQDSHLSQFYASDLALNPALAGMFDGNYRVHLHYRQQWRSLIKKPYETTNLSYDQPFKRFGVGAYIINNRVGLSGINIFNFLVAGAYEVSIDQKEVHHLTTGLQLGFIHKKIDPNSLSYDSQYDTTYTDGFFNPGMSTGETFQSASFVLPEVNFGVFYRNEKKNVTFNPYLGVSAFHLTKPKESFYGEKNRIPIRWVFHGGSDIKINKTMSAEANVLYMRQTNDNDLVIGTVGIYHLEGSDANIFFGPYYRNKDAVILHLGGNYGEYTLRLSYDINVSSLKSATGGKGGFEFSITYVKQKARFLPSIY